MEKRTSKRLGVVLVGLGATGIFTGMALGLLSWFMGPWVGGLGALPWVCAGAGLLMLTNGGVLVARS